MESWRRDMPPSAFLLRVLVRLTPGSSSLRGLLTEAQEPGSYRAPGTDCSLIFSLRQAAAFICLSVAPLLVKWTPLGPAQSPQTLQSDSVCLENSFWSHEQQRFSQAAGQSARKSNSLGSALNQWLPGVDGETPQPPLLLAGDMSEVYIFQLPPLDKLHHPCPCTFSCQLSLPESLPHASPGAS